MEKNTVTIDLDYYNELRDFKHYANKDCAILEMSDLQYSTCYANSPITYASKKIYYIDKSEAEEIITKANEKLAEENKRLIKVIDDLNVKNRFSLNLNDLAKMNYWEFSQWRKNNK